MVAAVGGMPGLSLVLGWAGRAEPAHVHLLAPRQVSLLRSAPAAIPSSAQHHASPATPSTASQSSATPPLTSGNQTGTTTLRHRSPTHVVAKHRATHRSAPAR